MEDLISLLLVAAFFILPLIQEALKAMRKTPEGEEASVPLDGPTHTPPIVSEGERKRERAAARPVDVATPIPTRTEPLRVEPGSARPVGQEAESIRTHSSAAAARAALEAAKNSDAQIRRETRPNEIVTFDGSSRVPASRAKIPSIPRVLPGSTNSRAVKGKVRQQAAITRSINSRDGMRTGIILREVLGPPVALRGDSELI